MWMCADIGSRYQTFQFTIGKQYWGASDPFEIIKIDAPDVKTALNLAAGYLRPNHMQTLVVVGQPK